MEREEIFFERPQIEFETRDKSKVIADRVYVQLRSAILSTELRANKRLVENELSEWLHVSRTPIREALVCLEKDGLVERKNGWMVHEHSPQEIRDRMESRLVIESYAARLTAGRRSDADVEKLRAINEAMRKSATSGIEYYQMNDHLHQWIVDASQNATLIHIYDLTKLNYWNLGVPIVYETELNAVMLAQHDEIIDAIQAGDGDRAEAISRNHIQVNIDLVQASLAASRKRTVGKNDPWLDPR
ncbi:transcriptional regulator [Longilinea arvoryzae]|uniref:Transcriptional regulator n=1 Tax=Longilinea arvoryzae TaxID=360412 RepID=A0A0S7BE31_9CHLR|nr:GntR family transcriptional regulator [Longilinea arvoryzae]GAP12646.1 transcriptional regulator [Longilinea arvoryzae]